MKHDVRGWGIWLEDTREWAILPPRLRKPSPHNTDLNDALIGVMRGLAREGHDPQLKRIDRDTLLALRKEHR
ncbi:hypothetical protein N9878_02210 [bacterium]|nr:hypothetical protein [bacterium]